ncbi:MAG: SDR family oxidoreductase [Candidatus Kapaibacterium sp.]
MKKIMIFGAASAIAQETALRYAADGVHMLLVDREMNRLETVRDHITAHHPAKIELMEFDATDFDRHHELFDSAQSILGGIDALLIAHGTLPDQQMCEKDPEYALRHYSINCTSVISMLTIAANIFEAQKKGTIAVITSVAGDRGRQSNYLYGAAKGSLSVFLSGLRNRLAKSGVSVVTIKPGMVDTPMTAHMPKNPLFAKPKDIGLGIYHAMEKGSDVVYLPGFWRLIMCVIRSVPEGIFKKLNL